MERNSTTDRGTPADTKLVICVWHRFSLWRPPESLAEKVRKRWPEMKLMHLPRYELLDAEITDTDIFVGYSIRPEQFALANRLKWIHSTAAGVGQLMYPDLRRSNVVVTNIRGVHSVPVAEHVIGAMIALSRRFPDAIRLQLRGHWGQQEIWDAPTQPRELEGAVLLMVGLGAIGKEVTRRARAFGMHIWAVTRSGAGDAALADRILSVQELDSALPQADFVVLAAPETPATRRLFGMRQFAAMKHTAFFVNVARGTLVDEAALADVLEQHGIAGAAIDVTEQEPLLPESPLWRLDNIFITPHVSAVSEHLWERQTALLLENLERWFSGRELLNQVSLARGY
jgi:phosphoglycerate dehydrogenase-like enzyme